jgi:hypothetical protein
MRRRRRRRWADGLITTPEPELVHPTVDSPRRGARRRVILKEVLNTKAVLHRLSIGFKTSAGVDWEGTVADLWTLV